MPPKTRQDFGGPDTVGMHVKRIGKNIFNSDVNEDFGIYFEKIDGLYTVGIKGKNWWSTGFCDRFEYYKKLEDLKEIWELD